ncbi:MAG TPA: hypothetical protein VFZ58_03970 [Candidatus Saccharimonadales bacterium]
MENLGANEYEMPDHRWKNDIFKGFQNILQTIGIPSVERQPGLPADRNGSRDEHGTLAYFRNITLAGSDFAGSAIPPYLFELGVKEIELYYTPQRVINDDILQEIISISIIDDLGLKKEWHIQCEQDGTFTTRTELELAEAPIQESPLADAEKMAIFNALYQGDHSWLSQDGAQGEFARMVHAELTEDNSGINEEEQLFITAMLQELRAYYSI